MPVRVDGYRRASRLVQSAGRRAAKRAVAREARIIARDRKRARTWIHEARGAMLALRDYTPHPRPAEPAT